MNFETVSVGFDSQHSASSCWVCGSGGASRWKARSIQRPLEPADLQITDDRYGTTLALLKCRRCGFIFSDDDEVIELVSLYERMSDPGYESSQEGRALQMQWLLKKAREANPVAKSVLDVGAGSGLLVAEANKAGWDAVGVEPSHSLVELARQAYQIDLIQGVFPHPKLAHRKFDLIFLVDIIEHVSDPVMLLKHCNQSLAPQGRVIVVTPDVSSLIARLLGQRWWHFRLAHVGYFNRRSLAQAAQRAGLTSTRRFSAKWFFRVSYIAQRLEQYMPIGAVNLLSSRFAPLHWLYDRVIPLNLHDSVVVILKSS